MFTNDYLIAVKTPACLYQKQHKQFQRSISDASFNNDLIEEVGKAGCLYNKQYKRYFDNIYKNNCWKEIALKINRTPEECKTRWKHLRETFGKKCKPKSTGSGAEEDTCPYFQSMTFSKKFIQPRNEFQEPKKKIKRTLETTLKCIEESGKE